MAREVELVEAPDLTAAFPGRFLARVILTRRDGSTLVSPDTTFRGELDDPFADDELTRKRAGSCVRRASRPDRATVGRAWSMPRRRRSSLSSAPHRRPRTPAAIQLGPTSPSPGALRAPALTAGTARPPAHVRPPPDSRLDACRRRRCPRTASTGSPTTTAGSNDRAPGPSMPSPGPDPFGVGFFGQARRQVDHTPIMEPEAALIADMPSTPGLVAYYNAFDPNDGWGNLVLRGPRRRACLGGDPRHVEAVRRSPAHYHSIRLHHATAIGGLLAAAPSRSSGPATSTSPTTPLAGDPGTKDVISSRG